MDTYLPPKFSMNAFFVRHVAHPKRMKYISGLNNAKICAVNDVGYINNLPSDKSSSFPPNNFNEELIKSSQTNGLPKRKERAIPPNGVWRTFGLIDNTDKWRNELNSLASSIGLLTQNDIEEHKKRKEREQMIKNLQKSQKPTSSQSQIQPRLSTSEAPIGRLNEPLLTGRRTRGSRASRGVPLTGKNYVVDQAEREAWMLQVLCQILQTESLVDVQSWLVSASDQEKERVKQLIDHAMKGLEESGRINTASNEQNPSNNDSAISNIENTLQKINLSQQESQNRLNTAKKATKLPYLMKGEEDQMIKKRLDSIPEVLKLDSDEPVSNVFNINMHQEKNLNKSPLENAVIKLETPRPADYKVEQVKVTMLVKDEKNDSLQEISGDWKP